MRTSGSGHGEWRRMVMGSGSRKEKGGCGRGKLTGGEQCKGESPWKRTCGSCCAQ